MSKFLFQYVEIFSGWKKRIFPFEIFLAEDGCTFLGQLKQMHCIATQADALPYEQIAQTFQGVSRETMGYKRPEETPAYTPSFSSNQSTNE